MHLVSFSSPLVELLIAKLTEGRGAGQECVAQNIELWHRVDVPGAAEPLKRPAITHKSVLVCDLVEVLVVDVPDGPWRGRLT